LRNETPRCLDSTSDALTRIDIVGLLGYTRVIVNIPATSWRMRKQRLMSDCRLRTRLHVISFLIDDRFLFQRNLSLPDSPEYQSLALDRLCATSITKAKGLRGKRFTREGTFKRATAARFHLNSDTLSAFFSLLIRSKYADGYMHHFLHRVK